MNEDVLAAIALVICALIPIIYMLIKHQQTMAKILHENQNRTDDGLRREVDQLKQLVMQQTITLDSLAQENRQLRDRSTSETHVRQF
ncbi:MAG: hypothetical protein IT363_02425 [Methanoregulaceae archaeon]|nr:hypothetical protein [Methanoregulaceae archaeon]